MQDVLIDLGAEGLGIFWCIIEQLYEQGGKLPMRSCKCIAFALHVQCEKVNMLINNYGLFQNDGEFLWSESVLRRLEERKNASEKRKSAALARWNKITENQTEIGVSAAAKDANAMQVHQVCNASASYKGKEIKENNNINSCLVRQESETGVSPVSVKADDSEKKVDFEKIAAMYHEHCPSYPRIERWSESRKRKVAIRFFDEMHADLDLLTRIFKKMEASKFLRGDNSRGWKATFDWLFANDKNWVKVAEGNYDNRTAPLPERGNTNRPVRACNEEWM